jgi:hypothetical protein
MTVKFPPTRRVLDELSIKRKWNEPMINGARTLARETGSVYALCIYMKVYLKKKRALIRKFVRPRE